MEVKEKNRKAYFYDLNIEAHIYFYRILKNKLQWTQLNPQDVLKEVKTLRLSFPWRTLEAYMKRAGITYAYMKKPCLDPTDPQCPDTAPNKKSGHVSICLFRKIKTKHIAING